MSCAEILLIKIAQSILNLQLFYLFRISVENIETEFSSLYVKTRSLEEKIQADSDLLRQLEPFLQVIDSC